MKDSNDGNHKVLEDDKAEIRVVALSKDIGGAAKATLRMFDGLKGEDQDRRYKFYCTEGSHGDNSDYQSLPWKGVIRLAEITGLGRHKRRVLDLMLRAWSRLIRVGKSRHQFFYSWRLIDQKKIEEGASLVHYVWVQLIGDSFIDSLRKPYIVTLHDMWHLTGGCAYSLGCTELENECRRCPEVKAFARKSRKEAKSRRMTFLKGAQYVVVTSEWMRSMVIKAGVHPEKVVRVDNYIPETFRFHGGRSLSKTDVDLAHNIKPKKILYFVGSIKDPRKGFEYLIHSLCKCVKVDWNQWELRVLGCKDEDLQWTRDLGISSRGCGILSDDFAQVALYNQADLLICPSAEDNSPNVIAEAHCCGLPTIVINGTGAAEMVKESVNGWIAEAGTVEALGETIEKALLDLEWIDRKTIAKRARETYGKESTLQKYVDIYSSTLNEYV